ncbi:hypothetical protein BOTBODRAFT_233513 [Botryobasidium botryosum FD-172 SS1]|uniref:CCZ1/INTU/HSP4 first Longin domain-containing protein n=1 Tax=Botryobasidium botryosum (strain FD-172 SS1) TaxID=930990 RepID=A0A067M4U5_BOTB1|nr:hypothetical protein BOTBODRAFT_233513 [Botryobasidium botryosum FD-172 SS1]
MARPTPSLSYLVIYNPTLLPTASSTSLDDEDALEQSHILFYTSRDRAVSRDRMLRQVGLAKALISFSEMFSGEGPCENVHSQQKRMIMVSPERNYWIHACVDLPRAPRQSSKGKGKGKAEAVETTYEYREAAVHDLALRRQILKGYDTFKLLHGSFDSIIHRDGVPGLEKLLERFFVVWAWQWDIEEAPVFPTDLGLNLCAQNPRISALLTPFYDELPAESMPLVLSLSPPSILPPRKQPPHCPPSLYSHLISHIPPPPKRRSLSLTSTVSTLKPKPSENDMRAAETKSVTTKSFISALPSSKSWTNWTGYLSFGKAGGKNLGLWRDSDDTKKQATSPLDTDGASPSKEKLATLEVKVDQRALDEAIASDDDFGDGDGRPAEQFKEQDHGSRTGGDGLSIEVTDVSSPAQDSRLSQPNDLSPPIPAHSTSASSATSSGPDSPSPSSPPSPSSRSSLEPHPMFESLHVYIPSESSEKHFVQRRRVIYLSHRGLVFALVAPTEDEFNDEFVADLGSRAKTLLEDLGAAISRAEEPGSAAVQLAPDPTTGSVIFDPCAQTVRMVAPTSTLPSSHLFGTMDTLYGNPATLETVSRTPTNQWYVASRVTRRPIGEGEGPREEAEIYMEVVKKNASLVDVDHELQTALSSIC